MSKAKSTSPSRARSVTVIYFPKGGPPTPVRKGPRTVTEQVAVTISPDGEVLPRPTPQASLAQVREGERTEEVVLPEATLSQVMKKKKTNEQALDLAMMGHQLFEAGRIDEAQVIFEGLVATKAKDAFPYTMLGTIYLAQGHLDRASKVFSAALVLDPLDSAAAVYKAEIRLHRGHSRSAVASLERVAKGDKADPFVRRARKLLKLLEPKSK